MTHASPPLPLFTVRCANEVAGKPCGARIAWRGTALDRPACSSCGHRPAEVELRRDQARIVDQYGQLSWKGLA